MAALSGHSGEMSQDSMMANQHRTRVPSRAADPAARNAKRAYNALSASSVGLELGLSVGIGLLVGYYLDRWLGTEPWLMLLWLVFGVVAGFRGVFRAVARADRAAQAEEQEGGGRGHA
jgi:ATP synthase protein I